MFANLSRGSYLKIVYLLKKKYAVLKPGHYKNMHPPASEATREVQNLIWYYLKYDLKFACLKIRFKKISKDVDLSQQDCGRGAT